MEGKDKSLLHVWVLKLLEPYLLRYNWVQAHYNTKFTSIQPRSESVPGGRF